MEFGMDIPRPQALQQIALDAIREHTGMNIDMNQGRHDRKMPGGRPLAKHQ